MKLICKICKVKLSEFFLNFKRCPLCRNTKSLEKYDTIDLMFPTIEQIKSLNLK